MPGEDSTSVGCPWCASAFGSPDLMLDHLERDHLREPDQHAGVVGAARDADARGTRLAARHTQRPRTPAVAVAAIGVMVLTAAAVLLPGEAPTGGLVFLYLVLVAYAVTLLAQSHPEVLGGPPRDARPHRKGETSS